MASENAVLPVATQETGPRMRVLSLVRNLDRRHGVAANSLELLEGLARRGVEIDVAYVEDGELRERYRAFAQRLWRVPPPDAGATWNSPFGWRLRERLPHPVARVGSALHNTAHVLRAMAAGLRSTVRDHIDLVFEVENDGMPWILVMARAKRASVVCQVNGWDTAKARRDRFLFSRADRVVAVSEFIAGLLVGIGVPPERIRVVHNGIDPVQYRFAGHSERDRAVRALGLDPAKPVVLYYGRLHPGKGIDVLIEASRRMATPHQVVIAGDVSRTGYDREMAQAAEGTGIVFLPHQADVLPLLDAADVVVLAATGPEAFGRVLIEAMSTGRPAVGTSIGGIPEVLTGEFSRFLAEPGDAQDLARVLDATVGWRHDDPSLGERAREEVVRRFSLDVACGKLDAVFREAVDARRRARPGRRA